MSIQSWIVIGSKALPQGRGSDRRCNGCWWGSELVDTGTSRGWGSVMIDTGTSGVLRWAVWTGLSWVTMRLSRDWRCRVLIGVSITI
jgi:hypothetical protein